MSARPEARGVATETRDLKTVGTSVTHGDFVEKVRGSLAFADDWQMPGMLFGRIVRAQMPSAVVLGVDVSEAAKVPGVVTVLKAADVPHNDLAEESTGLGMNSVVMPVLADERIRYHGEPVALLAAETPEAAEEAAELVVVDYEERPGVFTPEDALEPGAPLVHDEGNIIVEWRIGRGDAALALEEAPVVVEGVYRSQRVDHAYLEPEAGVGWMDGDGVLTLRVATQVIEHVRDVARIVALPQNRVRVVGTYMGGGFGGKEDMTVEPYLALLVWKTRRPVKMVWSRQESLLARWKRHPFVMHYRTGATEDGTILGQSVSILGDGGAYPLLSPRVLFAAAVTAAGPYRSPAIEVVSTAAFTNTVPSSAMRGFGAMQVVLAYEAQMDRLAEAVGATPVEIRERNFLVQGDELPTGEPVETGVAVREVMRTALESLGPRTRPEAGRRIGRGFACNMQPYGRARYFADAASCWLSLQTDGTLLIRIGVTDLGGGQAASLCQIASEVLGVTKERISIYIADTALTPLAGGTFATRQLYMSGNAVLKTAAELRDRIAPIALDLLGADRASELEFEDDRVAIRGTTRGTDGAVTLSELVHACAERGVTTSHLGTFQAEAGEFDPRTGRGSTFPDYTYGTHAADVEVDTETGVVKLLRYVACHDVGRAINPQRVEGQIQGGAAQGIGYALSEQVHIEEGVNVATLFADYLIPTSGDLPDIEPIVLEIAPGKGPFGARGIGEASIAPCAAALASAIADAVGVRVTELPMTPERILAAIAGSAQSQDPDSP